MTLTAQNIIDDVRGQIHDEDANNYRWSDAKLLSYMNLGSTEIVRLAPHANTLRESKELTASKTYQDVLPAEAISLIEVYRNMGSDGNTLGAVITEVELELLDRSDRNWHQETPATVIQQWMKHQSEPRAFFVYPPVHGSTAVHVEVLYSKIPTALTAVGDSIGVHESFRQQLTWFVNGNALIEDDPHADFPRGAGFMDLFYTSLGAKPKKRD